MTSAAPDRDGDSGLLDEARDFITDNALVLVAAAGALVLAYGFALTTFSISIDEETRYLGDRTFIWFDQGRPVIALVKFFLGDTLPLPFYNLAISLALLFSGGVMWAFLFMHAAVHEGRRRAGLLLFLVVFTTIPVNAYYLTFGTLNIESSLAIVWAAAGAWCAWLWAMDGRGWPWLIGSVVFVFLAVGTYQAFAFAALAGVFIAQLARLLTDDESKQRPRDSFRQSLKLALPIVVVIGLGLLVNFLLVERGGYTEETYIAWGNAGLGAIIERLRDELDAYLTGTGFIGRWVLVPTVVAALGLLALVIARGLWKRSSWYAVLLLLVVFTLPFGLSFALGTPLPNRALQALPLVAAGIWLLLALVVPHGRALSAVLLAVAVAFAVWDGNIVTRLFVTEQLTYEADVRTASAIVERLEREGWDGEAIPLVVVGRRVPGKAERLAVDETFGSSFFSRSQGLRAPGFMQVLGYPILVPDADERVAGQTLGESMPDWPAHGAVVLEDGLAIVRFSEP